MSPFLAHILVLVRQDLLFRARQVDYVLVLLRDLLNCSSVIEKNAFEKFDKQGR